MGHRSNQNHDELSVSEKCAEKLRSFNESDLTNPIGLGDESNCSLLKCEELQGNAICDETGITGLLGVSHNVINSTSLKLLKETRRESLSADTPLLDPLCCAANVAFDVNESSENLVGTSRPANVSMSAFAHSDRTVTFVGGVSADIGLSNIDAMAEQCSATVRVRPSEVLVGFVDVALLPREQLIAQVKFSQRSRYHFTQSAKNQLKALFGLTQPTVLDPGYVTQLEC